MVLLLAVGPFGRPAAAQVGREPGQSPYHDIHRGAGPVFFAGHLGGDRGSAGVGPSNAMGYGVRYEIAMGRATLVQFSAAYLRGDRIIVNPELRDTAQDRRYGPLDTDLLSTEVALQLRLTGGKTWHGFAPYLGTGVGMAFDLRSPGDTTGSLYRFGRKVTFSGMTGLRWHATSKVTVLLDARAMFWRLKYPPSFHAQAPDLSRVIPIEEPLTDWTMHPWVTLGIGWIF
jgi:hypothetical protein